jgi:hypothetical protein
VVAGAEKVLTKNGAAFVVIIERSNSYPTMTWQ